jgi:enoyl-CoA hydratase/3-hydroxyacyl-CoA dehydrogenase
MYNAAEIQQVAVIGAGDMGHGIAEVALLAGYRVHLYDIKQEYLDRGVKRIHDSLAKLAEKGKIDADTHERSRQLLHPTTDLSEAVSAAQFVIEAVPEVLTIKQEVFQKLDQLAPETAILGTNTSNMSISDIASVTRRPERVVGVHFFNPVVLMKLVEVIRGEKTTEETMQSACEVCRKLGKEPIRVEKDVPSFIVNRINAPIRVFLGAVVDAGEATPEEIDAMVRDAGEPMGPFELLDYVGLDITYDSMDYRRQVLDPEYGPFEALEKLVKAGHLGKKTGQGFYDWSNGRPAIDLSKKTDVISFRDIQFVKLNEATKLIEQGVSNAKDIDRAMVLGTGDRVGPIEACKDVPPEEIAERLDELASRYRKAILQPTALLRSGGYR